MVSFITILNKSITFMRIIVLLSFMFVLAFQPGCGKDPNRPDDLPKLYPVSITVTQEGKPLEGATVTLHAKAETKYGTCLASTDASGVAVIRTYGFKGVPLGQYSVTIEKRIVEGAKEIKVEGGTTDYVGGKVYQFVEPDYTKKSSTSLSVDVTETGVNETFEVGSPVHQYLMDVAG